jgi:DNA-binding SARP family transcriptional activator/LysM repeat protein
VDSHRGQSTPRKIGDVVGSLLTALLVFGATPAVLLAAVGNPFGGGLGHQWGHAGRAALAAVVAVAWLAWAACGLQLVRAVVVQVRRGQVSVPAGAVLTERVAGRIAAGVLSLIALATPLAVTAVAGASASPGPSISAGVTASVVTPPPDAAPAEVAPSPVEIYVVQPGDSLWSIAEDQLGDGGDWPAIAALNLGRTMPDGLQFIDPSRIYAGWTLRLPDATAPTTAAVAVLPARPEPTPSVPPTEPAAAAERGADGAPPPSTRPSPVMTSSTPPAVLDGDGPGWGNLPELAALGIGAITCAALTRRARRRRLLCAVEAGESADAGRSDETVDTEILLARFAGVPALRAVEAANCRLDRAWRPDPRSTGRAGVRAICVGAAGVDFWLAEPGQAAPTGFTLSADGAVWHLAHDAGTPSATDRPYFPVVLPVGEDDDGTWLVPLEPGDCLPFVGEAAGALWRASRSAQEAWAWSDLVLITEDPGVVRDEVRLQGGDAPAPGDAPHILFFGDPADLPPELAPKVSIVTLSQASGSDLVVLVDRRAASIHPLGRTVRPHLMGTDTFNALRPAVAPTTPSNDDAVGSGGAEHRPDRIRPAPARPHATGGASGPGLVEVKLLTPTPRLDGLRDALPPNRARRAVELVAYLALHQGEGVTSDRLRTRVLGSSDADAASKTLFNIATAARRALGTDETGLPLLPFGSKTGHYRLSDAVAVDVHQADAWAAEGSAAADPDLAMALLRAALSLVEGEPMALALTGYSWWEVEGHGARIAAVLVNAAANLAALAVDAGLYELAHWGLGQARLLAPYNEALSRTAMQVSAAAGDADQLRQEWRECQRRIDELDPGGTPSGRTEQLYGELSRQLLVSPHRANHR